MPAVYFDYAASTPLDSAVADAMAGSPSVGNPSAIHGPGRAARAAVDAARASVARLLGVTDGAVTFTSGATEANALAILGACAAVRRAHPDAACRVLTSPLEHSSVRAAVDRVAQEFGFAVDLMPVDGDGCVDAAGAAGRITPDTVMVTLMWANNVLGTIQPVADIGRAVAAERARRGATGIPILFHSDAVQALPSLGVRPSDAGLDLLTVSAHKAYGPKGVGALVREVHVPIDPLYGGGGQEDGLRNGTENMPGIVGFGAAAMILAARRADDAAHAAALRERLVRGLAERAPSARVIGDGTLPGIAFIMLPGVAGDRAALLLDAEGIAVSAGSACDAGSRRAPEALVSAIGATAASRGGVRASFGRFTSEADIDALVDAVARLR